MASTRSRIQAVLQLVLGIVIIYLVYFLYISITEPYEVVERRKAMTEMTRSRMDQVRTAMIFYERENGRFVSSLDSLQMWVREDSVLSVAGDSIFGAGFVIDSLIFSPRTGTMFELAINDSSRTHIYLLSDPDSDDTIGSLRGDITRLNAASWE